MRVYKYIAPLELGKAPAAGFKAGGEVAWTVKPSPAESR